MATRTFAFTAAGRRRARVQLRVRNRITAGTRALCASVRAAMLGAGCSGMCSPGCSSDDSGNLPYCTPAGCSDVFALTIQPANGTLVAGQL